MKEQVLMEFGKRIKELRVNEGLSQEKLAELIGVHRTYMGFIERGERNLTLINIKKLSLALNVRLPELFNFD